MQAKEQDDAAGGRHNRVIRTAPHALGRVVLRCQYRRLYAELRWTDATKQHAEYLGHWAKVLKADKHAIFTAAREAEKPARRTKVAEPVAEELGGMA